MTWVRETCPSLQKILDGTLRPNVTGTSGKSKSEYCFPSTPLIRIRSTRAAGAELEADAMLGRSLSEGGYFCIPVSTATILEEIEDFCK